MGAIAQAEVDKCDRNDFIRSLGLSALGIILGIAGFFTGGASWAVALGLGLGGAAVSAADLYFEVEEYTFHKSASGAVYDFALTMEPSAAGIAFAILGLVLDVADVVKSSAKLLKSVSKNIAEASAGSFDEVAESSYKSLKKNGVKFKDDADFEKFLEELKKSIQSKKKSVDMPDMSKGSFFEETYEDIFYKKIFKRLKKNEKLLSAEIDELTRICARGHFVDKLPTDKQLSYLSQITEREWSISTNGLKCLTSGEKDYVYIPYNTSTKYIAHTHFNSHWPSLTDVEQFIKMKEMGATKLNEIGIILNGKTKNYTLQKISDDWKIIKKHRNDGIPEDEINDIFERLNRLIGKKKG